MNKEFSYEKTLKTSPENSFVNIQSYFLITSKQITKALFNTSITPHQVILLGMLFGVASAFLIVQNNIILVLLGALLLFYKNVLDKVDGSLARAKGMAVRRGRFYDSISDFIVSLSLFTAMGIKLHSIYHTDAIYLICFVTLITSMLQCSYFIYYQVSFIKFSGVNTINRLVETITAEDRKTQDRFTLLLQRLFLYIYGWQDLLFDILNRFLLTS